MIPVGWGLLAMAFGVVFIVWAESYHDTHWLRKLGLMIVGHGCIIGGEVLAALYFVHFTLEKRSLKHSKDLLESQAIYARISLNSNIDLMTKDIRKEADKLTADIKVDLFKAILQGQNIMPYQMIDLIKSSEYNPNLLRTNFEIEFDCLEDESGCLSFNQTMRFDIKNINSVVGNKAYYDMHLAFNDTKQVSYNFISAEYSYTNVLPGSANKPYERVVLTDANFPYDKDRECRELAATIELDGGESVRVYQSLKTCYITEGNSIISDNFYATQYTIGVKISVKRLPELYEFWVYPTSTKGASSVRFIEGALVCDDIKYFLPGQGYFIELVKKEIPQKVV